MVDVVTYSVKEKGMNDIANKNKIRFGRLWAIANKHVVAIKDLIMQK